MILWRDRQTDRQRHSLNIVTFCTTGVLRGQFCPSPAFRRVTRAAFTAFISIEMAPRAIAAASDARNVSAE